MRRRLLSVIFLNALLLASPSLARTTSQDLAADPSAQLVEKINGLRERHRFAAAEQLLQPLLGRNPALLAANLQMGYLKRAQGEEKEAFGYFKQAATAHPESLEAQVRLVQACLNLERADEAHELAEHALEAWKNRNPDRSLWSELHASLGMAQGLKAKREGIFALTKYGLAVRSNLEKALALDADNALATFALGRYCFNAPRLVGGNQAKGLSLMARASKLDPANHRIRARYIQALKAAHQAEEARTQLARYQADFGDIPGAMRILSDETPGP